MDNEKHAIEGKSRPERETPIDSLVIDLPVNHAEATQLAAMRRETSNLARCYLDIRDALKSMCDTYGRLAFMAGSGHRIASSEWEKADKVLTNSRKLLKGMPTVTCGEILDELGDR